MLCFFTDWIICSVASKQQKPSSAQGEMYQTNPSPIFVRESLFSSSIYRRSSSMVLGNTSFEEDQNTTVPGPVPGVP